MDISLGGYTVSQIGAGIILWLLFALVYTRATKGIGKNIFVLINLIYVALFLYNPTISFFLIGFCIVVFGRRIFINRGRLPEYLPAKAKFEGGGIRRGLSPPEIEAVLGKPFHRILTISLIGLLDKEFLVLSGFKPIDFSVATIIQTRGRSLNIQKRSEIRRQGAQKLKQVLFPYEEPYLELLEQNDGMAFFEIDFSVLAKPFFQHLSTRIGGFSLEQTRQYYQKLIQNKNRVGGGKRGLDWILLSEESISESFPMPKWLNDDQLISSEFSDNETLKNLVEQIEQDVQTGLAQTHIDVSQYALGLDDSSAKLMNDIIQATYHS